MKRPKLTPENYLEIDAYFSDFQANKSIQRAGFTAMNLAYKADLREETPGRTLDKIAQLRSEGNSFLLAPKHQSNVDTPTTASLARVPQLSFLEGTTGIPSKYNLQAIPLFGRFFDHMLAYPTFRGKNYSDEQEESEKLRDKVKNTLIDSQSARLDSGDNVALMSEATRNLEHPRKLLPIREGIGEIVQRLEDPSRVYLEFMGYAYKNRVFGKLPIRPVVVLGDPICAEGMNSAEVVELAQYKIQELATQAFKYADAA